MKLFIITVDEVNDFVKYEHEPIVCLTLKEAKKELASIFKKAKKEYEDEDATIEKGNRSFSIYAEQSWSESHYEACIDEVEVPTPYVKNGFRLDVIFGSEASDYAANHNARRAMAAIGKEKVEGDCGTYRFDTEKDRQTAISLLNAADGWMGNFCEEI